MFNDQALMATLFSNTLYKYDGNLGRMQKYLEITPDSDMKVISSAAFGQNQPRDFMEVLRYLYNNDYSQGINEILLTSKYIYLNFWAEKSKLQGIVFNIETHKSFEWSFENKLLTDLDNYLFDFSTFSNSNTVVKILQSQYLIDNKTKYQPIKDLYEVIHGLHGEENPILLFYELNHLFESAENES